MHQEQDANFISRLHAGKLDIIPWPVIESRDFYRLFGTLKKRLDLQKTSHPAAGEFLHTIKTLMAKLKVRALTLFLSRLRHMTSTSRPMTGGHFLVRLFVSIREFYSHSQQTPWPSIAPNHSLPSFRLRWLQGMPRSNQIWNP